MIYSSKFNRSFRNRSELMRYEWRDRQTRPILSWGGLRDAPYSDQYRKEHGLPSREEQQGRVWLFAIVLWVIVLLVGLGWWLEK